MIIVCNPVISIWIIRAIKTENIVLSRVVFICYCRRKVWLGGFYLFHFYFLPPFTLGFVSADIPSCLQLEVAIPWKRTYRILPLWGCNGYILLMWQEHTSSRENDELSPQSGSSLSPKRVFNNFMLMNEHYLRNIEIEHCCTFSFLIAKFISESRQVFEGLIIVEKHWGLNFRFKKGKVVLCSYVF